jgi:phenylacetate-CoA ligase
VWQDSRLRTLVPHAFANVPFYRERWKAAGIDPAGIRSVNDLERLPVIPGAEMKSTPHVELLAAGTDESRCRVVTTSGSTGTPFTVTYSRRDHFTLIKAMSVRHFFAHGIRPYHRVANFTPRAELQNLHGWYERLGFWRRLFLHTGSEPGEWVDRLRRFRPHAISANPSTLRELAAAVREKALPAGFPKLVFSSGERLEPADRRLFEETFGCPVWDAYGAYEGGFIAWQCPRCRDYHVNSDSVIVEVLAGGRPAAPGEAGEVFITNLHSWQMPFIRYGLGDVAAFSPGSPVCGRVLPLIEAFWGRNDDCVRLPSGRLVGPQPIRALLALDPAVAEYRVVQESSAECVILIVPHGEIMPADHVNRLTASMRDLLGKEVGVRTEIVSRIERDRATKWKTVLSRVPPP